MKSRITPDITVALRVSSEHKAPSCESRFVKSAVSICIACPADLRLGNAAAKAASGFSASPSAPNMSSAGNTFSVTWNATSCPIGRCSLLGWPCTVRTHFCLKGRELTPHMCNRKGYLVESQVFGQQQTRHGDSTRSRRSRSSFSHIKFTTLMRDH